MPRPKSKPNATELCLQLIKKISIIYKHQQVTQSWDDNEPQLWNDYSPPPFKIESVTASQPFIFKKNQK